MKQKLLLVCAMTAMALTSCNQDDSIGDAATPKKMEVTASVDGMKTRLVDSEWENGDAIGLYADSILSNTMFSTTGDGVFSSSSDIYFTDTITHNFKAYYPYSSGTSNSVVFKIANENANMEGQKGNDKMFAECSANYKNPKLNMVFKHKMARIILNVKTSTSDGFLADDVFGDASGSSYTSSQGRIYHLYAMSTFYKDTGKVVPYTIYYYLYLSNGTDNRQTHTRTYVLVVPEQQACSYEHYFNKGTATETKFTTSLGSKTWKAGYSYTYNITIKNTGMSVASESAEQWTDGGSESYDASN